MDDRFTTFPLSSFRISVDTSWSLGTQRTLGTPYKQKMGNFEFLGVGVAFIN